MAKERQLISSFELWEISWHRLWIGWQRGVFILVNDRSVGKHAHSTKVYQFDKKI